MDYRIDLSDQQCEIFFNGRLTFNDHAKMRMLIKEAIAEPSKQIVFDLGELQFIDSAAVGMFLIAREEFEGRQKKLTLRNATGQVKRVITVSQLSKLITVVE